MAFDSLKNIKLFFDLIARCNGKKIIKTENYNCIKFENSVWPNLIYDVKVNTQDFDIWLQEIQSKISLENHPKYLMCNTLDINPELLQKLKKSAIENRYWASMTFDLSKTIIIKEIPDFKIRPVSEFEEINDWCQAAKASLFQNRKLDFGLFLAMVKSNQIEFYSGYLNDKVVAVSMLYKENDWAGIYCVGTLPEYERNGFGKAVTQYAMQRGKERGCSKAVLQATQAGEFVYKKIGYDNLGRIELFNLEEIN